MPSRQVRPAVLADARALAVMSALETERVTSRATDPKYVRHGPRLVAEQRKRPTTFSSASARSTSIASTRAGSRKRGASRTSARGNGSSACQPAGERSCSKRSPSTSTTSKLTRQLQAIGSPSQTRLTASPPRCGWCDAAEWTIRSQEEVCPAAERLAGTGQLPLYCTAGRRSLILSRNLRGGCVACGRATPLPRASAARRSAASAGGRNPSTRPAAPARSCRRLATT